METWDDIMTETRSDGKAQYELDQITCPYCGGALEEIIWPDGDSETICEKCGRA